MPLRAIFAIIVIFLHSQECFVSAQLEIFTPDTESKSGSSSSREATTDVPTTRTTDTTSPLPTAPPTPFPIIQSRKTTTPRSMPIFPTVGTFTTFGPVARSLTEITNVANSTTSKPFASNIDLTLKACCGTTCQSFDNLMSMVGLQCCGDAPMNAFEKICCNNQIHLRHVGGKYFDRCCGDRPYAWDQVCCRGKVYDGVPQASCCGDVPYSIYDRSSICCGEQLHKIPPSTGSAVCCGEQMYDDRAGTHFCCGDRLYSRQTHNGCCHPYPGVGVEYPVGGSVVNPVPAIQRNPPSTLVKFNAPSQRPLQSGERGAGQRQAEGYNSTTQLCCDRVYEKHEFDFCCYVADVNAKQWAPPVPRPYSSKTHCCDGVTVLEMDPKTKTCVKR